MSRPGRLGSALLLAPLLACGTSPPRATPPPPDTLPWSRLTGRIAYAVTRWSMLEGYTGPSEVVLIDASSRTVRVLKSWEAKEQVDLQDLAWEPGGRQLIVSLRRRAVDQRIALDLDGAERPLDASRGDPYNRNLRLHSGGHFAFCREKDVWVDDRPLVSGTNCDKGFDWSRDGTMVVLPAAADRARPWETSASTNSLWRLPLDGSRGALLFEPPADFVAVESPAFSPDGTRLAFVARSGTSSPQPSVQRLFPGQPGSLARLADGGGNLAWSPDGRSILYERSGDLRLIAADGTDGVHLAGCGHGLVENCPVAWGEP